MNLFFKGHTIRGAVVEMAKQRFRDDAQLRLARIANGKHEKYINGHPKDLEKGRLTNSAQSCTIP